MWSIRKLSLRYSLWDRDPTNDLNVIRFCLSLPDEQYVQNGMERSFIRRATKNLLPDKVRLNHHVRGIQGADTIHRMSPNWSAFLNELQELVKDPAMSELLNMDVVKSALSYIGIEPRPDIIFEDEFKVLIRSLIVYRFMKNFSEGGDQMKKMWKKPELEILDIRMTMNGPGNANADCFDVSELVTNRKLMKEGLMLVALKPGGGGNPILDS